MRSTDCTGIWQSRCGWRSWRSERTLIRHFKAALGSTPVAWLQTLPLDTARRLLERSGATVEAVANRVGYQDASAFARLFREQLGMTPGAYRARFRDGGTGPLAEAPAGDEGT